MPSLGPTTLAAGRFTLLRHLGSGGSGIVHEAYDTVRREVVAVKTLRVTDAATVHGLKREFRQLSNIVHPNLVTLYELIGDEDDTWCLAMELIRGVSFVDYVRAPGGPLGFDTTRLYNALGQVCAGLTALHEAGTIHRDLKPSNVLVTNEDRAVSLDFGIASEIAPKESLTQESGLAGTIHYIAPEAGSDPVVRPAVDMYALGVMVYECLTGVLPFSGPPMSVLVQKQSKDPPRPSAVAVGIPSDLDELCMGMMSRDPLRRLTPGEILRRLGRSSDRRRPRIHRTRNSDHYFVGRAAELNDLGNAAELTRRSQRHRVYLHGTSGIGKSALIRQFLDDLSTQSDAPVVLAGRCFDRETVPFKALDGVIDRLVHYLRTLSSDQVQALLPPDFSIACRLFPSLLRVDAIDQAVGPSIDAPDPIALRRRAAVALRGRLNRLAERQLVVVVIDDLQWGDADSIALLDDIIPPADRQPVLLLCSFRTEDIPSVQFLRDLLSHAEDVRAAVVTLGPLNDDDARRLLDALAPPSSVIGDAMEGVLREAGGSPFILEQLGQYGLRPSQGLAARDNLSNLLGPRLEVLPASAIALLETIAVAGHPIGLQEAASAAALESDAQLTLAMLRTARLVRTSGTADRIEMYHDHIREAIVRRLSPDRERQIHSRLAVSLRKASPGDPETLFDHFMRAGDRAQAAAQALEAASKSEEALAFDRAARFFRYAIELGDWPSEQMATLEARLGETLAHAGRPAEAAVAFLRAAELVNADAARILRGRAGEQLLLGGHIDRGLEVMRALLLDVGLSIPSTPRRALISLLWHRGKLRARGLGFTERPEQAIPELDRFRMDMCAACAFGLSLTDVIVSSDFQTRFLLLALDAGEPHRICRALALEAGFAATKGSRDSEYTQDVLDRAQALADRLGTPREVAFVQMMAGTVAFLTGEWVQSVALLDAAERVFRERCSAVMWELAAVQKFSLSALLFQGRLRELAQRIPAYLSEAQERGIPLAENEVQTRLNVRWLAADQPDEATRQVRAALQNWSSAGFHRQHYNAYLALIQADLYRGAADAAWDAITSQWSTLRRSLLMRVQVLRAEALHLRARAALAVAVQPKKRESMLGLAERDARALVDERARWIQPFASLIRAAIASRRAPDDALPLLRAAISGFDAANMRLYSAAATRRLGQYAGGDHGRALIESADSFMQRELIQDPARFASVLAPGFAIDDG